MANKQVYMEQVLCACVIGGVSLVISLAMGFPSPAIPMILKDTSLNVTEEQTSWIAAVVPGSAIAGSLISGTLMDTFGRRTTLLMTLLPFSLSWVMIAVARDISGIIVGRLLCGLCVGAQRVAISVYFSETVPPLSRSNLMIIPTFTAIIGLILVNASGKLLDWRGIAWLGSCLCLPSLLLIFNRPETPYYLLKNGQTDSALCVLEQLRPSREAAKKELQEMQKSFDTKTQGSLIGQLLVPPFRWPFMVALGLHACQQGAGFAVLLSSLGVIFEKSGSSYDAINSTVIVMCVSLFAAVLSSYILSRYRRKLILRVCTALVCLPLICLSVYIYGRYNRYPMLPVITMSICLTGFGIGWGPIPWMFLGEGIPSKIRGPVAAIVAAFNWSTAFVVTKLFSILTEAFGLHVTLLSYAMVLLIGSRIVDRYMPETFGRSASQMDQFYLSQLPKSQKQLEKVALSRHQE